MKQDFIEYIKKEFSFSGKDILEFEQELKKPLKKTIRINTNKIDIKEFLHKSKEKGWSLTKTSLGKNIFYIDRPKEQLDIALGNTKEHISGYFYVQELAASSSPYYMSSDKIDLGDYLILDMSASPGGKTTQLLEYYKNSLIVANELDKPRLKGLFSNLDRMSSLKCVVTNYDARFFKQLPELFDKVLLDAPCSGEGTAFKTEDSLKYRNIKNIKNIAKLQFGLLESALKSLKVGGEVIYSTCTLNKIENEGVIEKIKLKYKDSIEIIPIDTNCVECNLYKRSWPHIDYTGGFFVARIKKVKSVYDLDLDDFRNGFVKNLKYVKQNFEKLTKNEEKLIYDFFLHFGFVVKNMYFYKYKDEIHMCSKNINYIFDKVFLYKIGVNIGNIKNNMFIPTYYAGTFSIFNKNTIDLGEQDLDKLLKGQEIDLEVGVDIFNNKKDNYNYFQVICEGIPVGIVKYKNGKIKSLIPTKILRK